jgi:signal transduction histidine kinase
VLAIPVVAISAIIPLATAGGIGAAAHYQGLSFGQFWVALALVGGAAMLTAAAISFALRGGLLALARWRPDEPAGEAAEGALSAAHELPRRAVVLTVFGASLLVLPVAALALTIPVDHLTVTDATEVYLGGLLATLYATVLLYALFELLLRPIRTTFHHYNRSASPQIGLATKLLVALLFTPMMVGWVVGGLQVERDTGSLFEVYAVALVATLFGLLTLALFVEGTVLRPIRDLIRSTRRVGSGDLEVEVPVTTDDELGELTASFNEMVDDLRRSAEELRASRARIVAASDEARRTVERDLHDGAQQHLALLNLRLGQIQSAAGAEHAAMVDEARVDLDRALTELRNLAHGIYPTVLTSDGLPAALAEAAERMPFAAELDFDSAGRYPAELEAAVYFCCLEALQNAAKHAGEGAKAAVRLEQRDGELRFEVADDGRGFDSSGGGAESAGLQNMADRIGALGGDLRVESRPGSGTRVAGSVPLTG